METSRVMGRVRGVTLGLAMCSLALVAQAVQGGDRVYADDSVGPATTVTVLEEMTRKKGVSPWSGVILASDGNLYGTAPRGGLLDRGTIYRTKLSGDTKALHHFTGGADGAKPYGALVQGSDGALYGTSSRGDDDLSGAGVIFRITLDGSFTVLHVLNQDESEGALPRMPMIQGRDGYLYGTLSFGGGPNSVGVLYRISHAGDFAVVARFDKSGPYEPYAPLEGDDGNFYVAANLGGTHGWGGLLRVSPTTGAITTLYEFTGTGPDGGMPNGPVYDAAHEYLYGTTYSGNGIYRFRDGVLETITHLSGGDPPRELALGPDGVHFYTIVGHQVVRIAPTGEAEAVADLPAGGGPFEKLIFNARGAMFGTTILGGLRDKGTVFKVKGF
ncbi:choice-of-anchor tandem repeat GloVer-containing protein [Ideonella sp.]|uniref:choice-of-anchor tandem repeat GloVer-containing protein n=1 Tax=Ideonella sp. TaxID=1929293 RepID=UPI002B494871|nr:choice-of-anchor tandem repeat GloVer-containing protein [Ideonella sp.]HJV71486.1 choice-of-anchor tandem repeat GloVer-containing protein [Ideonella sp.]